MPDAVHKLQSDPEPGDQRCRSPTTSHGPPVATDSQRDQGEVDHDEAALEISRDQPNQELRWREGLPQPEEVLLQRMERLNSDQSEKHALRLQRSSYALIQVADIAT